MSDRLKSVLRYPSRAKASTAFGPHSTPPSIIRVKCTPRNGKVRVGHRVDQILAEVGGLGCQLEILAPERDDLGVGLLAAHRRHAIAVQPGAVDDLAGLDVAGSGRDDRLDHCGARVFVTRARGEHLAVALADALGQPLADLRVVDDARFGDVDRLDSRPRAARALLSRSRPITSQTTPLAWPRSKIRSIAGRSESSIATMTLPQIS